MCVPLFLGLCGTPSFPQDGLLPNRFYSVLHRRLVFSMFVVPSGGFIWIIPMIGISMFVESIDIVFDIRFGCLPLGGFCSVGVFSPLRFFQTKLLGTACVLLASPISVVSEEVLIQIFVCDSWG